MSNCHVCGASRTRALPQTWAHRGRSFGLVQCDACGSAFTDPLPGDALLAELYGSSFDYRWYRDHYAAKLRDSQMRVKEYGALLGGRVLDFGGGVGYFSAAAREAGLQSITYDPYVGNQPANRQEWDSVAALHVLEHSNNLERTLDQMAAALVPGGRLILAVPNFAGEGYRELGMKWVWAQPPFLHIFHFTATGLAALLARRGWTDLQFSYHERWDANRYCDIRAVSSFRKWDAAWGIRYLNKVAAYRKSIAAINSRRRFQGLTTALALPGPAADRSELQVTAVVGLR